MDNRKIVIIGCFDSKGNDFSFLYNCIVNSGESVITINTGVMHCNVSFPVDYSAETVAALAESELTYLQAKNDRGHAIAQMAIGAQNILSQLLREQRIKAVIGMGGGAGTYITLTAMQVVPIGIPKWCISTAVAKDLSRQLGTKDIVLMPSVVDVAGINSISSLLIQQAASAICAMANTIIHPYARKKGVIAISMFGNTTTCVNKCVALLEEKNYEVMAFHANGAGGRAMEALIREKLFDAVMDITTTELADELCGGVCSAGVERLTAAAKTGIPQIIVPGCLDMVNFAQKDTVPKKYNSRQLYSWSPDVTLMRTNKEENTILGKQLAEKANVSKADVAIFLPLKGLSQIDDERGIFYSPEANSALFDSIKETANDQVSVTEVNRHINDEAFATLLVKSLLEIIR